MTKEDTLRIAKEAMKLALEQLKWSMHQSAWDGVIQLSDALKNIDDFAQQEHDPEVIADAAYRQAEAMVEAKRARQS